ncbi:MAG: hypothetical protein OER86_05545 [Phycisphaerae bacterium]|nr:hypothetical protein [Phycisphaerae bacterium]
MHLLHRSRSALVLALAVTLSGCEDPHPHTHPAPSPRPAKLPLSPGVKVAYLQSGGIAGISDLIQVTHDWKLVVVADGRSTVRRVSGPEQKDLHKLLGTFATLEHSAGNDVPDAFSVIVVARGWGKGAAGESEAQALALLLNKLSAAKPPSPSAPP